MMISDCCGAMVYEETDICSDCKEHCEGTEEEDFYEDEEKVKISAVFSVKKSLVTHTERVLIHKMDKLISFRIMPNTDYLYENKPRFKQLVKAKRDIQNEIDIYINEHGTDS